MGQGLGSVPDVMQALKEAFFVPMGVEHRVVGGSRIQLLQVNQTILGKNGLHPQTADVVTAARDQHVRHGTSAIRPRLPMSTINC